MAFKHSLLFAFACSLGASDGSLRGDRDLLFDSNPPPPCGIYCQGIPPGGDGGGFTGSFTPAPGLPPVPVQSDPAECEGRELEGVNYNLVWRTSSVFFHDYRAACVTFDGYRSFVPAYSSPDCLYHGITGICSPDDWEIDPGHACPQMALLWCPKGTFLAVDGYFLTEDEDGDCDPNQAVLNFITDTNDYFDIDECSALPEAFAGGPRTTRVSSVSCCEPVYFGGYPTMGCTRFPLASPHFPPCAFPALSVPGYLDPSISR